MLKAIFPRWLLIITLLGMQYAILHHAVEHFFHKVDTSCALYISAEHQSNSLIQNVIHTPVILAQFCLVQIHYFFLESTVFRSFQARAPPL